jgi:ribosomal protein S18 acetylase RimI-like enzyme
VTLSLAPFALDQPTSLALAEEALVHRLAPGEDLRDLLPPLDSAIRSARAMGGLVRSDGTAIGIVVWEPAGPLGVAVRLLYLSRPAASADSYRTVLALIERAAGRVAFLPGPFAGLSAEEESKVMEEQGYASYGRSEMAFPSAAPLPSVPALPGVEVRSVREADEPSLARLHESAYRSHLDRYLSIEYLDPVRDADHQLRDFFSGRWGELLASGSTVVVFDGRIVAAALACRRADCALILDVMTDPVYQGRGFGRIALASALRALRDRGEARIVLNVTEGNERAIRLYSHLGFVRTIGPSREWYDARRMPVGFPPVVPR